MKFGQAHVFYIRVNITDAASLTLRDESRCLTFLRYADAYAYAAHALQHLQFEIVQFPPEGFAPNPRHAERPAK